MSFPLFFWFELLSMLVSLVMMKSLKGSYLFYFVPFLIVVVLVEFLGIYHKFILHKPTGWLYNLLNLILLPFWTRFFAVHIINKRMKMIAKFLLVAFMSFAIFNLLVIQGFRTFNNFTLITGSAIVILLCCYFLFEIFNLEEYVAPLKMPQFWIASGAFFYFTGTFFYFALYDYLLKVQNETGTQIFSLIILNLIIVLYVCISIGLLITKQTNKWKQQS